MAARNGVPRLVITHVPPWYDASEMVAEARTVFKGELVAAVPGLSYDIQ